MVKTTTLQIRGMTCTACARASERAVKKLSGIEDASVNFATEKMTVQFDEASVTLDSIKAAVKKAAPEPPAVKKTEIPKLQKISNPYSQVERMLFGPARGAQQAQPRGGRQPRGQ